MQEASLFFWNSIATTQFSVVCVGPTCTKLGHTPIKMMDGFLGISSQSGVGHQSPPELNNRNREEQWKVLKAGWHRDIGMCMRNCSSDLLLRRMISLWAEVMNKSITSVRDLRVFLFQLSNKRLERSSEDLYTNQSCWQLRAVECLIPFKHFFHFFQI